ncbi:MAG: NAD-dependent epimerase/dehydratase family protein [Alphaproteobacteria bacterium]|nr:NAD-dependent epimerase/dehydratase family protein [Alphaproteobacteria bacterium]
MPLNNEQWDEIKNNKKIWLVTGSAGFIGSHLVEHLLQMNQKVIGLDNLSACGSKNLDILRQSLSADCWERFTFIRGDIRDFEICIKACQNTDYILHHAAIGSVSKSLENPVLVDSVNVGGFLTLFTAAAQCKVKRFIYASSSAVYGDTTQQPNKEDQPLSPQSPYAVGKYANELYAAALGEHYALETIGLRYFNIYGSRQDPNGSYAAVIPKWVEALTKNRCVEIYGDGETVRDFCHVSDVVQANILAATTNDNEAVDAVYNIASGQKTSLNELFSLLRKNITSNTAPVYKSPRPADIRTSCANISKAAKDLSFKSTVDLEDGLKKIIKIYQEKAA